METIKVKADLQCPFCGNCQIIKVGSHRKAVNCPSCKQAVFLAWATGIEGQVDSHGFYFHAYEPFNIRKINHEFQDAFYQQPHHVPYIIRKHRDD